MCVNSFTHSERGLHMACDQSLPITCRQVRLFPSFGVVLLISYIVFSALFCICSFKTANVYYILKEIIRRKMI